MGESGGRSIPLSAKRRAYPDMPSSSSQCARSCIAPHPQRRSLGPLRHDTRPTLRREQTAEPRARPLARINHLEARRRERCRPLWAGGCPKFKIPNRLDSHGIFCRQQDTRANQNLTGFGFIARAGMRHWTPSRWRHNRTVLRSRWYRAWHIRGQCQCRNRSRAPTDATSKSTHRSPPAFLMPSAQPGSQGYRPERDH